MSDKTYLNLFVTETYIGSDKKERTNYFKVGALFPHENGPGFGITIVEGISVSGALVAFAPRDKAEESKDSKDA